jgi:Protein of unknown function (DUF4245)
VVSTGSTDDGGGTPDDGGGPTDDGGGTPETAVPEKPGRYQRSPAGMVGALIVTVLVILAFVVFRAVNRSDLDVKPERVDYLTQVRFAQQDSVSSRPELVYPARLPSGWYATHVAFSTGNAPEIALSMLTGEGEYVGFVQSRATVPDLLTTYVDKSPQAGSPALVPGSVASHWDTWTDTGGDSALSAEKGSDALLVFGTVTGDQLEQLAASLTTAPVGH